MKEFENSPDTWRLKNDVEDAILGVIDMADAVQDIRVGKEGGRFTLRRRKRSVVQKLEKMVTSTVEALDGVRRFDRLGIPFHSMDERLDMRRAVGELFVTMMAVLVEMEKRLIGEGIVINGETLRAANGLLSSGKEEEIMVIVQQAFSLKEAGRLLGCNRETLRRAIKRGELKASKIGGDYRVSRAELQEYWLSRGGGKLFDD